jgi:hypothetical protein
MSDSELQHYYNITLKLALASQVPEWGLMRTYLAMARKMMCRFPPGKRDRSPVMTNVEINSVPTTVEVLAPLGAIERLKSQITIQGGTRKSATIVIILNISFFRKRLFVEYPDSSKSKIVISSVVLIIGGSFRVYWRGLDSFKP